MTTSFDFIAACRPGMVLSTRDRSEATITYVSAADGLIHGEVRMFGPCVWRRDGLYRDAPAGAAGPLDLVAPAPETRAAPGKTVSMQESLDPSNRPFCCD